MTCLKCHLHKQFGSACEESALRPGLHLFFEVLEEVVNQGDALDGGASSEIDENRVGEDFRQGVVFQRFVRLPVFQLVAELAVDDAKVKFGEEVALLHAFLQELQRFCFFRARVSVNFLHDFGIFPDFFKETWFDGLQESESDFERFRRISKTLLFSSKVSLSMRFIWFRCFCMQARINSSLSAKIW